MQEPHVIAGRYRLEELIARGGMGEVVAGRDLRLDREVVIKRLREDLVEDPAMRRRVEAEARLAAALNHRNVVAIFDTGEDEGRPYIVMERLDRGSLHDALARGPMSQAEARRLGSDVLAALGAAHGKGLVHRDLKPANILLADDGSWKVADFGIARLMRDDARLTLTGEVLGSPSYVAPECLSGSPATAQSDLYSVGVVLYEALSGRRPFESTSPLHLALLIRDGAFVPLGEARPQTDASLVAAVERAMSRNPAERFASAEEMAEALRRPRRPRAPAGAETVVLSSPASARRAPAASIATRPMPAPPAPSAPAGAQPATADTKPLSQRGAALNELRGSAPGDAADAEALGRTPLVDDAAPRRRSVAASLLFGALALVVAFAVVVALALAASDGGGTAPPSVPSPVPGQLDRSLERLEDSVRP